MRYLPSYRSAAVLLTTVLLLQAGSVKAQSANGEPDLNGFVIAAWNTQLLNNPSGFLPVEPPSADVGHTFQLLNARVYLRGRLDDRIGYDFKTELNNGLALLTAFVTYRIDDRLSVAAGRMLKPFGRERMLPQHLLPTLTRSVTTIQTSHNLRYGKFDVGAMFSLAGENGFTLRAGIFNGAASGSPRDTDTGKNLVVRTTLPLGPVEIGANASWLHLGHTVPAEGRDNLAWGVDARFTAGGLIIDGEVIQADDWASFDPIALESPRMMLMSVTGTIPLPRPDGSPPTELVVRLERFDRNEDILDDEWLFLAPNLNIALTQASRLQVGVIAALPADDAIDTSVSGVVLWQVNFF